MKKRYLILAAAMGLLQGCHMPPHTSARVSIGAGYPGDYGFYFSTFPDLAPIPGYPVYYAPGLNTNYFFYDGLYWVFYSDNWYVSSWYNGPWTFVSYYEVPVFILRIPVRYYRLPPPYFHGWPVDAPPRWAEHWGRDWEQRRSGWERWDRNTAPAPAPLPTYQRNYAGDRYPRAAEQQHTIRSENYRYQPRDPVAQQYFHTRVQQVQQRESTQQRQPEQQRPQVQQREPSPQRLPEQQRPQSQQRDSSKQHQPEQQRPQVQQRQPEQQHPQERQDQRERAQPEPRDRDDRAAPQDRGQRNEDDRQNIEQPRKSGRDRDQNR